jgi:hypothetical protein
MRRAGLDPHASRGRPPSPLNTALRRGSEFGVLAGTLQHSLGGGGVVHSSVIRRTFQLSLRDSSLNSERSERAAC